jgi:predicted metal-dependent phosphoesterase TrpH
MNLTARKDSDILGNGAADLHIHTSCSDGWFSPGEVARLASEAGLSCIAITDHDTVAGLEEAEREARRLGVKFVPGIELSVEHEGQDFHFLAYWIDPKDERLTELLGEISVTRVERAKKIVTRLNRLGVSLRFEQVARRATDSHTIGRPHVAHALIKEGWVSTFPEAFARYLRIGAPAYVPKNTLDPVRALEILREAGGVPILAHPGIYRLNGVLQLFLEGGLQGIEIEHPMHSREQVDGLRCLAKRYDLAVTGGSDFHGGELSEFPIGARSVPVEVLKRLAARKG